MTTTIVIYARDYYSRNSFSVEKGVTYNFEVSPSDKWFDLGIPSSANGFNNIFLRDKKKRLQDVMCFALCGTYGQKDEDCFYIGCNLEWTAPKDGKLYFFANDHRKRFLYLNNFGKIKLVIR